MSSKAAKQINKHTKLLLIIVAVMVLLILGWFAWSTITNYQNKHKITDQFNSISIPNSLILQNKVWIYGSIDNGAHWAYFYSVKASRQVVHNALRSSLKNAGYTIDNDSSNNTYIAAHNQSLTLSIYLEPYANPSGANIPEPALQTVSIDAFSWKAD